MSNLPPELNFNFVDEMTTNDEIVEETHTINTDITDINDTTEHLSLRKQPIEHDSIFDNISEKEEVIEEKEEKTNIKSNIKTNIVDNVEDVIPETPRPITKTKTKPIKYNKDGTVRKARVYTEEQKAKMRERMKYAREQSGKNKTKREEKKAQEKKYKELMEKKKQLDMEDTEERLKKKSEPKKETKPPPSSISIEDVRKAQFDAIVQYETIRKARKQKKKQEQQIKQYNEDVKTNLKKELGWKEVAGIYQNCF